MPRLDLPWRERDKASRALSPQETDEDTNKQGMEVEGLANETADQLIHQLYASLGSI